MQRLVKSSTFGSAVYTIINVLHVFSSFLIEIEQTKRYQGPIFVGIWRTINSKYNMSMKKFEYFIISLCWVMPHLAFLS